MDCAKLVSLEELVWAIDIGLDIEFFLHGVRYNISTDGTPFITICPDGDGDYYEGGTTLVTAHKINDVSLKEQWRDIDIWAM